MHTLCARLIRPSAAVLVAGTALTLTILAGCSDNSPGTPGEPGTGISGSDAAEVASGSAASTNPVDLGQLYQLQAAYHAAASVRDPVNGDTPEVILERIREILALWADDGVVQLAVGSPRDGIYAGRGDPADPESCPTPSDDPAHRGTLCTLYKYVSGSFQPQNKFVSLAPTHKTHFTVHGITGTIYFECHYFDVSTADPSSSNNAAWTPKAHAEASGTVRRVDGRWVLSYLNAPMPPIPAGH